MLRLLLLVCNIGACRVFAQRGLHAVPLLRKPADPTGRISLAEEGLAVLRAHKGRFGIVAAVGPTRTGKSTILGRGASPHRPRRVSVLTLTRAAPLSRT